GERAAKWVKRNPALSGATGAGALIAAVSFIVVGWLWLNADFERGQAVQAQQAEAEQRAKADGALIDRDRALGQARVDARAARVAEKEANERKAQAEERERETQRHLANGNVLLAQAAWHDNKPAAARERLEAVPPDLRKWEWYYLNRQYQGGIF